MTALLPRSTSLSELPAPSFHESVHLRRQQSDSKAHHEERNAERAQQDAGNQRIGPHHPHGKRDNEYRKQDEHADQHPPPRTRFRTESLIQLSPAENHDRKHH